MVTQGFWNAHLSSGPDVMPGDCASASYDNQMILAHEVSEEVHIFLNKWMMVFV
jgi:hypothetical protein